MEVARLTLSGEEGCGGREQGSIGSSRVEGSASQKLVAQAPREAGAKEERAEWAGALAPAPGHFHCKEPPWSSKLAAKQGLANALQAVETYGIQERPNETGHGWRDQDAGRAVTDQRQRDAA